eukprot:7119204-Prymnesium_polylepis.1
MTRQPPPLPSGRSTRPPSPSLRLPQPTDYCRLDRAWSTCQQPLERRPSAAGKPVRAAVHTSAARPGPRDLQPFRPRRARPRDALNISRSKPHIQAHAIRPISWPLQRAVRSDTEHATRDARHETAAGAASCIPLSCPITRQTIPDPPNLPYPTRRCEERERVPRSTSCTLLVEIGRRRHH